VSASAARPSDAAIPSIREDKLAASTSATGDSNLTPLLPMRHHVEVLDTKDAPEKEEIDMVVVFAAPIGQTH
jgi:hypothetical protein